VPREFGVIKDSYFQVQAIPIRREIPADAQIGEQLKKYEESLASLSAACEENVVCPKAKAGEPQFVGANACKSCHQAAYDVWTKSVYLIDGEDEQGNKIKRNVGHSKAWQTLTEKKKEVDRTCIGCHSVGFQLPGGYCKASEVAEFKNVQCESCHGAGSLHAKSGDKKLIRKQVSESTCRGCHHVPHIPTTESFVYEEKVQKILGPGHGEAFLQKLKPHE